MEHVIHHWRVK